MPNWKNPSDYPDENAPPSVWRWEFLRRNKEYRKDYENNAPNIESKWGVMWPCHPDEQGTTVKAVIDSNNGLSETTVTIQPHTPQLTLLAAGDVWNPGNRNLDNDFIPLGIDEVSKVAIVFDCTLPIKAQIDEAKKYLETKRKRLVSKESRKRTALYPTYLRVFDAVNSGISKSKVAEIFGLQNEYPDYSGDKTVTNWLNAANLLVNGGYREI